MGNWVALEMKMKFPRFIFIQKKKWRKIICGMGGSPGLVVMGGDSCSKGGEFESQHRILDGHLFVYLYVVKFVMCVLKGRK